MQDSTNMPPLDPPVVPAADAPSEPTLDVPTNTGNTTAPIDESLAQVVDRVNKGDNILVALSKNPSVDELTSAIALTMYLDKYGKHATAIFSGKTPNAIKFLRPEETLFENTDSLQDFIIALNKEKADHLRYKLEGDFVKVYITPYKTKLDEKDLEFSYGEYNVDLVIALNVPTRDDLDAALSEHGRIMHDATSININAGPPQNFGDLEWGDPSASSVSEMVFNLIEQLDKGEKLMDASMANALLAGLISATERFSNSRTSSTSMSIASRLLESGADQQMVSASIGNTKEITSQEDASVEEPEEVVNGASISIDHGNERKSEPAETEQNSQTNADLSSTLDELMAMPTPKTEELPDPMPLAQPEPEISTEPTQISEQAPISEPDLDSKPASVSEPSSFFSVTTPTEPHTPTSTPDFSVAPPTIPESETSAPSVSEPATTAETTAETPIETPAETPAPVAPPTPIEAPIPPEPATQIETPMAVATPASVNDSTQAGPAAQIETSSPAEIPAPIETPDFPQMPQASSSLDALLPPPPPPPAAPNSVLPEPAAPNANFNPQIPEPTVSSISSFQIPDTGQDEGIFGSQNTNQS